MQSTNREIFIVHFLLKQLEHKQRLQWHSNWDLHSKHHSALGYSTEQELQQTDETMTVNVVLAIVYMWF